MRLLAVILLAVSTSGCWAINGPMYTATAEQDGYGSQYPALLKVLPGRGEIPAWRILAALVEVEAVVAYPPKPDQPSHSLLADGNLRVIDAIRAVELDMGWVYDAPTKTFRTASATHSIDSPDTFGHVGQRRAELAARGSVVLRFRFVRLDGSLDIVQRTAGAGGSYSEFAASFPDGVNGSWSSVEQRSYFDHIDQPSTLNSSLATTRRSVEAGTTVQALAARLPGGKFRLDGTITVSAFIGPGLDLATVTLPLQCDAPRGQWHRVYFTRGAEAQLLLSSRRLVSGLAGSASAAELLIRVD